MEFYNIQILIWNTLVTSKNSQCIKAGPKPQILLAFVTWF